MSDEAPLRIVEMRAENVKAIRAVAISPEGHVVEIAGRNAQGKSSVLDAIWMALGGAREHCDEPIRRGAEKAEVELDLGEVKVRRTWTAAGSRIAVETPEGAVLRRPQDVLDKLIARAGFDPLAFARATAKERREQLLHLVDVGIDLEESAGRIRGLAEERRDVGREARQLQAAFEEMDEPEEFTWVTGVPQGEVSASELLEQLAAAEQAESERAALHGAMVDARAALTNAADEVAVLEQRLADARTRKEAAHGALKDAEQAVEAIPATPGPTAEDVRLELSRAEETNRCVRAEQSRQDEHARQVAAHSAAREAAQAKNTEHLQATEALDAARKARADALAAVEMPIEGLSVGEEDVAYHDVPLSQCSTSEQIRVGLALAMAASPRLRVALVRDGSLLDDEAMAELQRWAEEHDAQAWVERVGAGGDGAWVIEAGEVVRDAPVAVESAS